MAAVVDTGLYLDGLAVIEATSTAAALNVSLLVQSVDQAEEILPPEPPKPPRRRACAGARRRRRQRRRRRLGRRRAAAAARAPATAGAALRAQAAAAAAAGRGREWRGGDGGAGERPPLDGGGSAWAEPGTVYVVEEVGVRRLGRPAPAAAEAGLGGSSGDGLSGSGAFEPRAQPDRGVPDRARRDRRAGLELQRFPGFGGDLGDRRRRQRRLDRRGANGSRSSIRARPEDDCGSPCRARVALRRRRRTMRRRGGRPSSRRRRLLPGRRPARRAAAPRPRSRRRLPRFLLTAARSRIRRTLLEPPGAVVTLLAHLGRPPSRGPQPRRSLGLRRHAGDPARSPGTSRQKELVLLSKVRLLGATLATAVAASVLGFGCPRNESASKAGNGRELQRQPRVLGSLLPAEAEGEELRHREPERDRSQRRRLGHGR